MMPKGTITVCGPELCLPWPDKALSPNARVHWSDRSTSARIARECAFYAAREAKLIAPSTERIHIMLDFYPPIRRWPDHDNMLSRCKPYLDGIADAIAVNDRRFVPHPYVVWKAIKGGEVRVRIYPEPEKSK